MSDYEKCLASAQKSLALREHSEYQIKNKLLSKGFNEETIDNVINRLKESGFQCDERYVKEYIKYRQSLGYGLKKIIFELRSNGINSKLINDNLSIFENDYNILYELAKIKINNQDLENQKNKYRYINFFLGRGFEMYIILKVIKNYEK